MAEKASMRDEVRTLRGEVARLSAKLEHNAESYRSELQELNNTMCALRTEVLMLMPSRRSLALLQSPCLAVVISLTVILIVAFSRAVTVILRSAIP